MTPSSEVSTRVHFWGLVLDVDARTLARDSGEVIALTRGEFALLRFLLSHPGRAVNRDTLLSVMASRRHEPFDRSVDVLIGRLRRKIEPDPKRPRLIVTVPGEGYRFDGFMAKPAAASTREGQGADPALETCEGLPPPIGGIVPVQTAPLRRVRGAYFLAALCLTFVLALGTAWRYSLGNRIPPYDLPGVVVFPFANITGDASKDYLARTLAHEITALLGAYPGLRVVAAPVLTGDTTVDAALALRAAGARFAVQGGVRWLRNSFRVTATLYDDSAQAIVWSQVFDSAGGDARLPQEDIARRIYDSLAGFRGAIRASEERVAWAKSKIRLNEYDYYLRGQSLYLRSTLDDVLNARAIYQEGLEQHPVSVLLRINLSWTYLWTATNQVKSGPGPDIEQAWRLAREALSAQPHSRLEAWLAHWLMAFLHQWHDEDFPRSLAEAWAAVELAPYDGLSRNGLSRVLANAGYGNEAIAWARSGLDHDPNAPSWYRANLAWASHVAGRDQEAIEVLREKSTEYPVLYAALHARLGRIDEARALVADYVKSGGGDVIEREDMFPILEPIETEYLEALRKAGLPER